MDHLYTVEFTNIVLELQRILDDYWVMRKVAAKSVAILLTEELMISKFWFWTYTKICRSAFTGWDKRVILYELLSYGKVFSVEINKSSKATGNSSSESLR